VLFLEPSKPRQQQLIDWYRQQARDLPWRRNCLPYSVWISEMMLQQTQVKTVTPKFQQWLRIFPNMKVLARASEDDVMKAWEGLGYYRRARFIHRAAKYICEHGEGEFPQDFESILALPGIGRSTAGAISSICFGTTTAVLDGNVKRVLRRWYGCLEATDKQLWALASHEISLQKTEAGNWNQAMMELGATLCLARNIQCQRCPVQTHCISAHQNSPAVVQKKVSMKHLYWQVWVYQNPKKGVWLEQRPTGGIWAKLWCLPIQEIKVPEQEPDHIHVLTHRRLHLYVEKSTALPQGEGKWVIDLDCVAIPTGIRRLLDKVHF